MFCYYCPPETRKLNINELDNMRQLRLCCHPDQVFCGQCLFNPLIIDRCILENRRLKCLNCQIPIDNNILLQKRIDYYLKTQETYNMSQGTLMQGFDSSNLMGYTDPRQRTMYSSYQTMNRGRVPQNNTYAHGSHRSGDSNLTLSSYGSRTHTARVMSNNSARIATPPAQYSNMPNRQVDYPQQQQQPSQLQYSPPRRPQTRNLGLSAPMQVQNNDDSQTTGIVQLLASQDTSFSSTVPSNYVPQNFPSPAELDGSRKKTIVPVKVGNLSTQPQEPAIQSPIQNRVTGFNQQLMSNSDRRDNRPVQSIFKGNIPTTVISMTPEECSRKEASEYRQSPGSNRKNQQYATLFQPVNYVTPVSSQEVIDHNSQTNANALNLTSQSQS